MRLSIAPATLFGTLLLTLACHRVEPSFVPLGLGPKALAEAELQRSERPIASTKGYEESLVNNSAANGRSSDRKESQASSGERSSDREGPGGGSADRVTAEQPEPKRDLPSPPAAASSENVVDEWAGLYRGNDTTTFAMTDQEERRFDDPKAKIRVEAQKANVLRFALVDSTNEKDICQLSASVDGDNAKIDAGQSCFLDPDESMTTKSRPGSAVRKGRHLTFDLVLDTRLETEDGVVNGTIEYHFEGDRS